MRLQYFPLRAALDRRDSFRDLRCRVANTRSGRDRPFPSRSYFSVWWTRWLAPDSFHYSHLLLRCRRGMLSEALPSTYTPHTDRNRWHCRTARRHCPARRKTCSLRRWSGRGYRSGLGRVWPRFCTHPTRDRPTHPKERTIQRKGQTRRLDPLPGAFEFDWRIEVSYCVVTVVTVPK